MFSLGTSASARLSLKQRGRQALMKGFSPAGLRVLVVDDDPSCLKIIEALLLSCEYNVTTCSQAMKAYELLEQRTFDFDVVISDVHMPDLDGFKLLEMIGLQLDLPVIMMSADGNPDVVLKGITHGACDYLLKPVRRQELQNIWQHVVRRRVGYPKAESAVEMFGSIQASDQDDQTLNTKKRKETEENLEDPIFDISAVKKDRVSWTPKLHQQFVNAVNELGLERAVPKSILDKMNVQGLTRENVASHLQKYRLGLKKLSGVIPKPHPVASFQAAGTGGIRGVMGIRPGGRGEGVLMSCVSEKGDAGVMGCNRSIVAPVATYHGAYQQRPRALDVVRQFQQAPRSDMALRGLQRMASVDIGFLSRVQERDAQNPMEMGLESVDDLHAHTLINPAATPLHSPPDALLRFRGLQDVQMPGASMHLRDPILNGRMLLQMPIVQGDASILGMISVPEAGNGEPTEEEEEEEDPELRAAQMALAREFNDDAAAQLTAAMCNLNPRFGSQQVYDISSARGDSRAVDPRYILPTALPDFSLPLLDDVLPPDSSI